MDPQSWNKFAYGRNNPVKYIDPDGKAAQIPVAALAGGLIRAGMEVGKQMFVEGKSLKEVDQQKVGAKFVSGAIEGAVAGATAGASLLGFFAANTAATVGAGAIERAIDGDETTEAIDGDAMKTDAAAGVVGSATGKLLQGVTTGDLKTIEIGTQGLGELEKATAKSAAKGGLAAGKVAGTEAAKAALERDKEQK